MLAALGLAAAFAAGAGRADAAAGGLGAVRAVRTGAAGVISTVAGGVGGPARAIRVAVTPCGVSFGAGRLYVAAGSTVRAVTRGTGQLTTPAGTGLPGVLGDRGPAAQAVLVGACGVAVDGAGNLLIADTTDERIRVVAASTGTFYGKAMTAGDIYTVAGDGRRAFSGDGGPATGAALHYPADVAVDGAGNLAIADSSNQRIRVVAASTGTFYGQAMTAGDIYTVAGDGAKGFAGDGGPATGAELNDPAGVAVDPAGNLVIADKANQRVRLVAASTGTFYGQAMTAGHIYTVAGTGTAGFSGDGGPGTSAELNGPAGVAVDPAGNLLIAASASNRVRVVAASTGTFYGQAMTTGDIYTVAGGGTNRGDGGPATQARLLQPSGIAVDGTGNLLIADTFHYRVRVVAASTGTFFGRPMTAGDIYTVAGDGTAGYSGDGSLATHAELSVPEGVAVDHAGNLAAADAFNQRIRLMAATTGTFFDRAMTAGDVYTVAGDGVNGYSGDGGPATRAEFSYPGAIAVDGAGSLVVADTQNMRIRVVAARTGTFYGQAMTAAHIYTVAGDGMQGFSGDGGPATSAELDYPRGIAVDGTGNLLIGDSLNNRVRVVAARTGTFYGKPMAAGDIYTIAGTGTGGFSGDGGPATSAELSDPTGVAVDGAGNLLIADFDNCRIRVVAASTGTFYGQAMTAGHIYTVAGNGIRGLSGDGGPATSAEMNDPGGAAMDPAGNLVIADSFNGRIRVVAASSGTFYGQAMTAGNIYTVAGGGVRGLGDGGPATSAMLSEPGAVALDPQANLVISDDLDNRIRIVTH